MIEEEHVVLATCVIVLAAVVTVIFIAWAFMTNIIITGCP